MSKTLRPLRDEITDLPNLITLGRIALIPFALLWIDNYSPGLSALACLIFLVAAATDALDGYLARRLGLVTVLGTFLDPLADKLIILSTLVMLVAKGRCPAWLVILLMARDLAVTGLRAIASQQGLIISASRGGKTKTALQLAGISFLLVHFRYDILFFDRVLDFHQVGIYILYVSLVMSLASGAQYFQFFVAAASKNAEDQAAQGVTRVAAKERLRRRKAKIKGLRLARRQQAKLARKQHVLLRRKRRKKP